MVADIAASVLQAALGLDVGPAGHAGSNRFALEGLSMGPARDGSVEFRVEKLEAATLRLASGPLALELGRLTVHDVAGEVRMEAGTPRLRTLHAASAELAGVKASGNLEVGNAATGSSAARTGPWCLAPLAAADGTLRAEIVDAHLLFDADVTVPIREGQVDFSNATVEHVGPDSRMGISRLGLYVDAPNGRSYLYQFPSAPVAGVEYEQRGALLGPWVTNRGKLWLQPFVESLLHQPPRAAATGFTEQARQLFDRTAVSGDVQLGDGRLAAPGLHADLAGRADRHNLVRVHSEAVGRGITLHAASLLVRNAASRLRGTKIGCDGISGEILVRVIADGPQLRLALDLPNIRIAGLHLEPATGAGAGAGAT